MPSALLENLFHSNEFIGMFTYQDYLLVDFILR